MPKIAILSLDPRNGGGVLHSQLVAYNFLRKHFEPTLFFINFDTDASRSLRHPLRTPVTKKMNLYGMDCVGIGSRWAIWEPGHYSFMLPAWDAALAEYEYFFVTSGTAIAAHPLALLNKKFVAWLATPLTGDRIGKQKSKNPFLWTAQTVAWPKMLNIEKEVLTSTSFLLPMSNYAQQSFNQLTTVKAPQQVCGYPIEVPALTAEKNINPTCVSVARFSDPRKDVATLLTAWRLVLDAVPTAKLYLVGSAPDAKILQKYEEELSAGQIQLFCDVSETQKMELLQQAHVAVIPSLQEGLCIAGLEAASCGLPIVSTACGGPEDYVLEGLTGYLVPCQDSAAMAQKIIKLFKNPTQAAKIGKQGRALVQHFYSETRIHEYFKQALVAVWPELRDVLAKPKNFATTVPL